MTRLFFDFEMVLNENEKQLRGRLFLVAIVAFAVLYSIYSLVILPIYIASLYNIAYEGTVTPDLLNYLAKTVEMVALAIFYGVVCYGMYRLGNLKMRSIAWVFVGGNLYKYTCNTLMTWKDGGSIPLEWGWDILNVIYYTAMEMITFALVWFLTKAIIERYREKCIVFEKVGKKAERVFPFSGIYKKGNCLMFSAFISSLLIFGLKFLSKVINDLLTVKQLNDITLMIVAYALLLLFGIVCYFVMIFTMMTLDEKLGETRIKNKK